MSNNKDNGFSKGWEWNVKEEEAPLIKSITIARQLVVKHLRDKGQNVSGSAGYIGLARRIIAEQGKTYKGKMKKKAARRIITNFAFSKNKSVYSPKISPKKKQSFYRTPAWRKLRYEALIRCGRACMCCGAKPSDGIILHVDHVKPRSKYPKLALDINNLQILCEDCNLGKSNIYEDDFRDK